MYSLFETNEFLRSIEKLEKRDAEIIQKNLRIIFILKLKSNLMLVLILKN